MNEQQNIEKQLWDYIDGLSSAEERGIIESLLQNNIEWKNKYHELLEVQQLLTSTELDQPSMRFTKNVMEEIAKLHIAPATKNYINKKIIWGIGAFFITLIVGFLIYGFAQIDWNFQDSSKPIVDFSKVNYGKIFNNNFVNVFMMMNVVLGLVLLDRVLANKRKQFQKDI
jgi:regulatory protein YycI of two-component signal transduction system YycFG